MKEINFDDLFLNDQEFEIVHQYCMRAPYSYGESDNGDNYATGMVHDIPETEFVYKLFKKKIADKCPFVSKLKLYRMYINCFAPCENPRFHTDGNGMTFLYYANVDWDVQQGGETQFLLDGSIYGVLPIPNRIVMFDGTILHRATSFRDAHRFTLAIKYESQ